MLLDFVAKPKNGFFACFCYVVFFIYVASFSERRRNSVFRFYKKSSTLLRVVWAGDSKTGLGIKIRPPQQKL